jgi:hypothetical protein
MSINYNSEEWKTLSIQDLEENERYAISNLGRLKSFKATPEGKIIKSTKVRGYEAIVVRLKNNRSTTRYIHKLVAEHFIPKDNEIQQYVIHLDFNKQNNQISNLCWVTKSTMFAHQKINPNYTRGLISNSKLTETDVMRLKMKLSRGKNKLYLLASEFGITHTQLNRIRRGENWSHVKLAEN